MLNERQVVPWMKRTSEKIKHRIIEANHLTASMTVQRAKEELPRDTGHMARSYRITKRGDTVSISNTAGYIKFVDKGRHAFKGAPKDLQAWAMRRLGIPTGKAYGVAKAIAAKPRKGKHFFSSRGLYRIRNLTRINIKRLLP